MWTEMIRPGIKIYVSGPDSASRYVSRVECIDRGVIFIDPPVRGGREKMRLAGGDLLAVYIPGPYGLYRFTSQVLISPEAPGDYTGIAFPDQVSKTDMRSFMRVNKLLKVQYSLIPSGEEAPALKKAEALNISAGGMKLAVPEFIEQGCEVKLQFVLPAGGSYSRIKVPSQVKWTVPEDLSVKKEMFLSGVWFHGINRKQQDLIQQYVLKALWLSGV